MAERQGAQGFARTVAIKTILANGAEEEAVRLFLDEARVAAAVEHGAIVQTFDLGYENETLFIAMEYVAGPTLSRLVRDLKKKHGRLLDPPIVAYIGARVASALDYAHRRATGPDGTPLNLVHRDISPQNILLTRTGLVKLSDFGVARASIQTHKTKTGQVRGKAAYMAPEQVRAKQLDGRTDIFALGLVLFEALTAKRVFHRKGDIQSMRAVLSDPVPSVLHFNPDCPAELDATILRCVEKDPNKRFQNAGEMEQALLQVADKVGSSRIEHQITEIIDEVFGEADMYTSSDEGPAVEAWQPTIAAEAIDLKPMKLSGQLDPEVARMLQSTSSASQVPLTPPSSDANPTTPQPSYPELSAAHSGPSGAEAQPFVDHAHASRTGLNTLAPTQTTTKLLPRKRLLRFGLPVLAALLGVVTMMGWRLLSGGPEPAPEPIAPAIEAPLHKAAPAVVARPEPASEPIELAPKVRPKPKRTRVAHTKAPKSAPARPAPAKAKPKPKNPSKLSMDKRILAAVRGHKEKGNTDLAKKLQRVLMNLSMGAQASSEDWALLKQAEAELR